MGRHRPDTGISVDKSAPATYTGAPDNEHRPSPDRWSAKDHRPGQHRQAPAAWPRRPGFTDGIVCWGCGKPGHMRRNCNQPAPDKTTPVGTAKVTHGADQANVYLAMELQGRCVPCLLDTGCDITLVPRDVIDRVPDLEIRRTKHRMWAANGTEIQLDGEAVIPFVMDGHRLHTEALVSPDIEETMIGSEWMQAQRCLWDFHGSQLYIDGQPAVMLSQRRKLRCRRLYADQDTVVPARQQIEVPARTTLLSARAPADTAIVETRQVQLGVYLGRTLLPPEHRNLRINVVNTTTAPRTVTAGEWLGNLQQVEVLADRHGKAPATE